MRINLSATIALLVVILMLVQGGLLYLLLMNQSKHLLEQDIASNAMSELTRLQGTLEYLSNIDDITQIQEEISALGSTSYVIKALVFDENNQVLASTKISHLGTALSRHFSNKEVSTLSLPELRKNMAIRHWKDSHSKYLTGLAPFRLGDREGGLKPDKTGIILLQYDMKWIKLRARQYLVEIALPIFGSSALLALLLGLALYFLLTRRINRFNMAAERVAQGDFSVRINSKGIDELGSFARTFDQTVAHIEDNTQQLIAQNEAGVLREKNLTVTLDSIGDAVITTDAKGSVIRMNPTAEQLTGWRESDALSRPLSDVFNIINAESRKKVPNPVEKVLASRRIIGLANHTSLLSKSGEEHHIADSAAPIINSDNETIGVILVFHDISLQYQQQDEINKSRQFLQSIIDNSPSLISVRDLNGNFLLSNKAHAGFLGYTSEQVTSSSILQLFGKEIADHYIKSDQEAINQNDLPEYEETHTQEGKPHTFVVSKFKLQRDKKTYGVGTIATDVTVQKEQAEQLRRSQKMDALGKLTGGVAHDYNNMLGVILGYAELLSLRVESDSKLKNYADEIIHAAERGADLTKRLLSFASSQPQRTERIQINSVIINAIDMLKKTLTAKIAVDIDLQADLWEACVDRSELENALVNLSINAMHAMPDGGTLKISTKNYSLLTGDEATINLPTGDYVVLVITDTGVGISKENQMKIFDPFFTTKGEMGNGLGLSQVYGFVTRGHGAITVISEPSKGATFMLYLPRNIDSCGQGAEEEALEECDTLRSDDNKLILIVDDEPALGVLAGEILQSNGYRVITSDSGKEALCIIKENKVDLLLTDVIMPQMDGHELVRKSLEVTPDIKVLYVSGYIDKATVDDEMDFPFIQKPYKAGLLLSKINEILHGDKN